MWGLSGMPLGRSSSLETHSHSYFIVIIYFPTKVTFLSYLSPPSYSPPILFPIPPIYSSHISPPWPFTSPQSIPPLTFPISPPSLPEPRRHGTIRCHPLEQLPAQPRRCECVRIQDPSPPTQGGHLKGEAVERKTPPQRAAHKKTV